MLKKAGIIVAVAATGLLAAGSFAFADETVTKDNLSNACPVSATGPVDTTEATGGFSLLGVGGLASNIVAPITTQVQALNCTNLEVSDLVDSNSGNTTETETVTKIKDSNNTESDD